MIMTAKEFLKSKGITQLTCYTNEAYVHEKPYIKKLIELCQNIVDDFGDELD